MRRLLFFAGFIVACNALGAAFALFYNHLEQPPSRLDGPTRDAALALVRAQVESEEDVEIPAAPGLALAVNLPVAVSAFVQYQPKRQRSLMKAVWPAHGETLGQALRRAASGLREKIEEKGWALEPGEEEPPPVGQRHVRLKVDVVSAAQRILLPGLLLRRAVLTGTDGLMLGTRRRFGLVLPSEGIEREWHPRRILRAVRRRTRARSPLRKIRSESFMERALGEGPGRWDIDRANVHTEPTLEEMVRAVRLGAFNLAGALDERGRFDYSWEPVKDHSAGGYNILRHAGSTYSMFLAYRLLGDPEIFEAAARALAYLHDNHVEDDDRRPGHAYVKERNRAKLGGMGLAMLAYVEYALAVHQVPPVPPSPPWMGEASEVVIDWEKHRATVRRYEPWMEKLAAGMLVCQRGSGFFDSYYPMNPDNMPATHHSIYYPGEAALGLVRFYRYTGERRWLDAAVKAVDFLIRERWHLGAMEWYTPPDHWLVQALSEIYEHTGARRHADYAYKVAFDMARDTYPEPDGSFPDFLAGASFFYSRGSSVTPVGSRNEAYVKAYRLAVADGRPGVARYFYEVVQRAAGFQVNHYFRPETSYYVNRPDKAAGGFRRNARRSEVRIDYVQHNITGLLGAIQMLRGRLPR